MKIYKGKIQNTLTGQEIELGPMTVEDNIITSCGPKSFYIEQRGLDAPDTIEYATNTNPITTHIYTVYDLNWRLV